MACYSLEPWGMASLKWYIAQQTAAGVNVHLSRRFTRPSDYIIEFSPVERTVEENLDFNEQALIAFTKQRGGRIS